MSTATLSLTDPLVQHLRREWDDVATPLPETTLPELFARRVSQAPDAIALETDHETVSYAELSARADTLAWRLAGRGVLPGDNVAVLMRRSPDLVAVFLAVAKAGAAFVPLEPSDPLPRMRSMIAGPRCVLLLVDAAMQDHPITEGIDCIRVFDSPGPPDRAEEPFGDRTPGPDALLYILHTSGSTGEPKGVGVTHRNLIALALDRVWRSGGHERVLFHSRATFDASAQELWVPLLAGDRVVIAPGEVDATLLRRLAGRRRITGLWLPAGAFAALAEGDAACLAGVREVWTGGDVVSRHAAQAIAVACAGIRIYNGYGPTETTTCATRYLIPLGLPADRSVPIGTPMDNTRVYVLDGEFRLLPSGQTGNVYIAGAGVTRGYVNRPGLTAQRFLPDPFGAPGERMYATGDLARREPDGTLSFLGRADDQVKIRGFRVEPSEIESVLAGHPGVARAVVFASKTGDGDGRVVAFVVPVEPHAAEDPAALRGYLAERLPEYMVPARIEIRSELPLTGNGKVDRRRLADSVRPDPVSAPVPASAACSGTVESRVADLWTAVLGIEQIGPDDNFFDLGGNSLKLIGLHARLCRTFGIDLPVQRLFEFSTIRAMARYLQDPEAVADHASARPARGAEARRAEAFGVEARGAARRSRREGRKDRR
jgi:amino acid adenylation domain-containing protein